MIVIECAGYTGAFLAGLIAGIFAHLWFTKVESIEARATQAARVAYTALTRKEKDND